MGEELALAGKLIETNGTWAVVLEDGQRLRLPTAPKTASGQPVTLIVTTPDRHQQDKQELARHLLTEILNGS